MQELDELYARLHRLYHDSDAEQAVQSGGPGCLNKNSASLSRASAWVRLPSGVAAG